MKTVSEVLSVLRRDGKIKNIEGQERFGINTGTSLGLTVPQIRALAKKPEKIMHWH